LAIGDLGDTSYHFGVPITLDKFSKTGIGYFYKKCLSSEVGRPFREWDENQLLKNIHEHFSIIGDDKFAKAKADGILDATGFYSDWAHWLQQHGDTYFGQEWYEGTQDEGYKIHHNCHMQLEGLQLALKQLEAKKVSSNENPEVN